MTEKKLVGVKIWLDKDLLQSTKGSGELLTCLEKLSVPTIIEKLPVSHSIFWTRTSPQNESHETQHDHILVQLECDCFIDKLNARTLNEFVLDIKQRARVNSVSLLVAHFKTFYKSLHVSKAEQRTRENYANLTGAKTAATSKKSAAKTLITKSELHHALIELELGQAVCVRSYESVEELKDITVSYTKAIAEYAAKRDGAENLLFCDKAVEKAQARVAKDGQGMINLWKEMVETFPLVAADQAQAICSAYPSPLLLMNVRNITS